MPRERSPVRRARERANLQLHQPLGGEADHLAQKIGVGGAFPEAPEGSSSRLKWWRKPL